MTLTRTLPDGGRAVVWCSTVLLLYPPGLPDLIVTGDEFQTDGMVERINALLPEWGQIYPSRLGWLWPDMVPFQRGHYLNLASQTYHNDSIHPYFTCLSRRHAGMGFVSRLLVV